MNELRLIRVPLGSINTAVTGREIIHPELDICTIAFDRPKAQAIIRTINEQVLALLYEFNLVAETVLMCKEDYEQVLAYSFDLNGEINIKRIFNLCICVSEQCNSIEVLCSPQDEMLYYKELSELRMRSKI